METIILNREQELNSSEERDAAALLYQNSLGSILVSFFAATLLIFAFNNSVLTPFKQTWWGLMLLILSVRLVDSFWWRTKQLGTQYNGRRATLRFVSGTLATAVMWCIYSLSICSYVDTIELASTIIIVSAMAGGATSVLAANKKTAMAYSFILLVPFSIGLLMSDDYRQVLGVLGLSFGLVMMMSAKKAADFTAQVIKLKNENTMLVHHMEEQVEKRTRTIYELSNLDALTGLFNRTAFLGHLKKGLDSCIKYEQPMALLFIDLDGFKKINDTIGHNAGDQILTQTAARLKERCSNPALLCRWGGDEFLLALPNTQELDAVAQAQKLIECISKPYLFENTQLSLGATIGIALYPQHTDNELKLIQLADMAMYHQKKRDISTVGVFSETLGNKLNREQYLKDGLARAIESDELRLNFQPIIASDSGRVSAFEALLRWQKNGENIAPMEFIPIAEQYGFIRKIGGWVLNQACIAAKKWPQQVAVTVNVSVNQLQADDFIHVVDSALLTSQLPATLLHLEVTESVFSKEKDIIIARIKLLQSRGIKVSIDDFGTEYSSLSVMQDLAVNIVKIDRSFIARLDSSGLAIVKAVINIAKAFNYQVVAEGVETEQQAQALQKLGVHFSQGFFFSRPIEEHLVNHFIGQSLTHTTNINADTEKEQRVMPLLLDM
ncbi:MAG: diguanylate cyclase (GGDEF)-like protein [Paraglaciecola sp.]